MNPLAKLRMEIDDHYMKYGSEPKLILLSIKQFYDLAQLGKDFFCHTNYPQMDTIFGIPFEIDGDGCKNHTLLDMRNK